MYNDIRDCPDTVTAVWAVARRLAAGTFAGGKVFKGTDPVK
jgi:hypothetical protein